MKKCFIMFLLSICLTGCGNDVKNNSSNDEIEFKEIEVKPITIEENIIEETILYENVTTYWD